MDLNMHIAHMFLFFATLIYQTFLDINFDSKALQRQRCVSAFWLNADPGVFISNAG